MKQDQLEAINDLRELIKAGDTVYTILRHRSASGMTRWLDLYVMRDNKPRRITWTAARAIGWTYDRNYDAVKVGGCGMDMGFHAVYTLSHYLFREGFGIEGTDALGRKVRPLTKAKAAKAVEKGFKFYGRNGDASGWDNDGGYALNHEWL